VHPSTDVHDVSVRSGKARLVIVGFEYGVNGLSLNRFQGVSISLFRSGNFVLALIGFENFSNYRAIRPSLYFGREHRASVPHKGPSLRVVKEFLKLHGIDAAKLPDNVCCDIMNFRHRFGPRMQPWLLVK
jgi:hypothetical protein